MLLEGVEAFALAPQPRLHLVELLLDDRLAVAKNRDLAGENVDPSEYSEISVERTRLVVLLLAELRLLLVELRLQVLGAGGARERQREADRAGGGEREERSRAAA